MSIQQKSKSQPLSKNDYSQQIKKLMQSSQSTQYPRMQIKLIIFLMFISYFNSLQMHGTKYLYMNPVFHCQGMEQKQSQDYSCRHRNQCSIIGTKSITSQLHLYCDQMRQQRVLIQSSAGIGMIIGILFAAIISDRFGRTFCFIFGLLLMALGCIMEYIGMSKMGPILFITISQVIFGVSGKIVFLNFLIIATRFLNKSLSQTFTVGWLISSSLAQVTISLFSKMQVNWQVIFLCYFVGLLILSILSLFILYEDPIFYFDKQQYSKCKKVIEKIGYQNNEERQQIQDKLKLIDEYIQQKQKFNNMKIQRVDSYNLFEIIRFDIISSSLILALIGFCYSMVGIGIDYSIQTLPLSYNQGLLMIALSNFIGLFTAIYIIKYEKQRKRGYIICSILCGIPGLLFAFDFCLKNAIISSISVCIVRVTLCWLNNLYLRLKIDRFPQKYQGLIFSLIHLLTNFGRIFAPLFVQLSQIHNLNPIFTMSTLRFVVGTISVLFLQEKKIILDQ